MGFYFEADTADEAWLLIVDQFRSGKGVRRQESRDGPTHELPQVLMSISHPRQRWVVSRSPALNPAFAIADVVWMLQGREDSVFLNHWNPGLPKYAGDGPTYHGAYGHRLRRRFGLDQLNRAYETLSRNPETRQVVLQIWDPRIDLPDSTGRPVAEDIPCNVSSLLKIRGGRLEWTQIMRSNDVFRGLPHNFVQFTTLQEIVAGWLGVDVGPYHHLSDSLHVYDREMEKVLGSAPTTAVTNTDRLALSKPESDRVLAELERRLGIAASRAISPDDLRGLADFAEAPEAYRNWVRIALADDARRRDYLGASRLLMAECNNPALRQLWDRWFERRAAGGTGRASIP